MQTDELRIRGKMEACGVPKRFLHARLEDFSDQTWAFGSNSLYLCGPAGTGKTYRAVAMLRREIEERQNVRCRFVSMPELLLRLRATMNEAEEQEIDVVNYYGRIPNLFLDDLGAERVTDWTRASLYIILDRRYANCLPTVITSNWDLNELGEYVGDRIASRIAGMCEYLEITGPDRRTTASTKT